MKMPDWYVTVGAGLGRESKARSYKVVSFEDYIAVPFNDAYSVECSNELNS
jgi:hypothetical protein